MSELTINDVRSEVRVFVIEMERKLRMNDHKEHWSGSNYPYLHERLSQEIEEMDVAYFVAPPVEIAEEAVDVANFAMMIFDN